jgi:hypothetical protein
LCQIITTFTTGITALNGLTAQVQFFTVGTSGTDFNIASATATHTFNLPTASATNRGALSSADWTTFNSKQNALTNPVTGTGASGQIAYFNGTTTITSESNLFWDATNDRLGIGTATPAFTLDVNGTGRFSNSLTTGADITLSAANPFIYGGTAAGSLGLSNIGGQTYVRVFGASHATTPNITQFVNSGSTSLTIASTGAATFSSSVTANATSTFSNASNISAIFSNGGAVSNYNSIELRGGTGGTAVNWQISKDNTVGNAFQITPSTSNGGTSYTTPSLTILSSGNVGIGTANPAQRLSVEGEIAKYCGVGGVDGNFENLIKYGFAADLQSGAGPANRWIGIDATVTAGSAVVNTLRIRAYSGGTGNAAPVNVADFRGDQSSTFYGNVLIGTQTDNGSRLRVNGSLALPHTTKTANYTLDSTDYTVGFDCASNRTATLPDATTCQGRIYVIYQYNTGSGARSVTLDGNGSQTINGVTTYSLSPFCEYTSVMIQSNGANWIIISSNFTTDCL